MNAVTVSEKGEYKFVREQNGILGRIWGEEKD